MNDDNLQLQYASQSIQYSTQFVASMTQEEVILDCGSVLVPDDGSGSKQLPIHTRMALPWSAAERLHRLLGELIEARQASSSQSPSTPSAALPPFSIDASPKLNQPLIHKPHRSQSQATFRSETP